MEKLWLFLILAFLFNQGICQAQPNSTPKNQPTRTSKDQPNSTSKAQSISTPKDQSNSTLKNQPNSTSKAQSISTPKDQSNSTLKNQPNSTSKAQSNSTLKNQSNSTVVPNSNTTTLATTTCIPITTRSVEDCIQSCPVTPEYNPVCGTNNITYDNPGRLLCAQSCGVNVKLVGYFRCPPPTPAPSG